MKEKIRAGDKVKYTGKLCEDLEGSEGMVIAVLDKGAYEVRFTTNADTKRTIVTVGKHIEMISGKKKDGSKEQERERQHEALMQYARNGMKLSKTAKEMGMYEGKLTEIFDEILMQTGLDPRWFFDLAELLGLGESK